MNKLCTLIWLSKFAIQCLAATLCLLAGLHVLKPPLQLFLFTQKLFLCINPTLALSCASGPCSSKAPPTVPSWPEQTSTGAPTECDKDGFGLKLSQCGNHFLESFERPARPNCISVEVCSGHDGTVGGALEEQGPEAQERAKAGLMQRHSFWVNRKSCSGGFKTWRRVLVSGTTGRRESSFAEDIQRRPRSRSPPRRAPISAVQGLRKALLVPERAVSSIGSRSRHVPDEREEQVRPRQGRASRFDEAVPPRGRDREPP
ncbi:unnamed protein product, partial [Polarella glacialis]